MTIQSEIKPEDPKANLAAEKDQKPRKRSLLLLALLLIMLLCLCATAFLLIRYLIERKPLPELIPQPVNFNYPPHYLYSIYGVDQPVATALSPDGSRIYVAEMGGERLIKMFDRQGNLMGSFAPPGTNFAQRAPTYIAVSKDGRVYVTDRMQFAIFIYDPDGKYLDSILAPGLSLSEYVSVHIGGIPAGTQYSYNIFKNAVDYQIPGRYHGNTARAGPGRMGAIGYSF